MEVEGRQPRALPLPAPSPHPEGSRGLSLLHSSLSHLLSRSVGSAFARVAGAAGLRRVPLSLLAEGRVPQPLPAPLGRGGPCPSTRCMRGAGVAARPGRRRPRKAPARLMRCQEVTGRLTGGEPGRNLGAQPLPANPTPFRPRRIFQVPLRVSATRWRPRPWEERGGPGHREGPAWGCLPDPANVQLSLCFPSGT